MSLSIRVNMPSQASSDVRPAGFCSGTWVPMAEVIPSERAKSSALPKSVAAALITAAASSGDSGTHIPSWAGLP